MVATTAYTAGTLLKAPNEFVYLVVSNGTLGTSLANFTGENVTNGSAVLRRALKSKRRGLVVCNRTSDVIFLNFGRSATNGAGACIESLGSFAFSFDGEVNQMAVSVWSATNGLITGLEW